ncbi:MAG: hypothetical protein L0241_03185, partial [Planctomycetia bacterium]|nr:hypothetical protein [Planctomycetia bacterium]
KLEVKGKDKVYNYFNGKVVEGPGKGKPFASGSYTYTLNGDTWTEVYGASKYPWMRVKEKEKESCSQYK